MESDLAYFTRRARDERSAAMAAAHKLVKLTHLEFALAYEYRIRMLLCEERRSSMHLVKAA